MDDAREEETPAPTGAPVREGTCRPLKVLAVDDVEINLQVLALRLRKLGVPPPRLARSAAEARMRMEEERPDAVFTDVWMPGESGIDFARALKGNPSTADIPVVALTADGEGLQDRTPFADVLGKPLTDEALAACLARLDQLCYTTSHD